jgi:hypothetical protein
VALKKTPFRKARKSLPRKFPTPLHKDVPLQRAKETSELLLKRKLFPHKCP